METEIKKRKHRKGGTDYAKEKLAKAEAENKTLKDIKTAADKFAEEWKNRYFNKKKELDTADAKIKEHEETIRKQGSKISDLSARLSVAQGNEEEWKRKYNEAIAHVPFWRRWLHGL